MEQTETALGSGWDTQPSARLDSARLGSDMGQTALGSARTWSVALAHKGNRDVTPDFAKKTTCKNSAFWVI